MTRSPTASRRRSRTTTRRRAPAPAPTASRGRPATSNSARVAPHPSLSEEGPPRGGPSLFYARGMDPVRGLVGEELSRRDLLRHATVLGSASLIVSALPVAERILADPA